jgi:hypothetical protein
VLTRTKEGRDHVDRLVEVLDGLSCKYSIHVLERLGRRVPSSSVEDRESSPALGQPLPGHRLLKRSEFFPRQIRDCACRKRYVSTILQILEYL